MEVNNLQAELQCEREKHLMTVQELSRMQSKRVANEQYVEIQYHAMQYYTIQYKAK